MQGCSTLRTKVFQALIQIEPWQTWMLRALTCLISVIITSVGKLWVQRATIRVHVVTHLDNCTTTHLCSSRMGGDSDIS